MSQVIVATVNCKKRLYASTSDELAAIAPNIPMGLLVSYLAHKGVPVELIDSDVENIPVRELAAMVIAKRPKLLCLVASGANPSASTMSMVGILDFFKEFSVEPEAKGITTAIWGPHPTVLPERTLAETGADYVIRGEGYETITGLYESLVKGKGVGAVKGLSWMQGGKYCETELPALVDVDSLPMIDWSRMNPAKYRAHNWHCFGDIGNRTPYAIVWTSMGCPYTCNFCCINNLFGKRTYRMRSIDNVIAEIDVLVNDYGIKNIKILDELFIIKHPRIDEFCARLEERNYGLNMWCFARVDTVTPEILKRLKKVGMNWVAYGFESVNHKVLENSKKRYSLDLMKDVIRWSVDAGVYICADAIFGLWDDDMDSMNATKEFLFKHNFEWINIYPAFAFPGTELYDEYIRQGVIQTPKTWDRYSLYGYECECLPTKYLAPAEVLKFRDGVFSEYFTRPEFLKMIDGKFGAMTREHCENMTRIKLKRRILGD